MNTEICDYEEQDEARLGYAATARCRYNQVADLVRDTCTDGSYVYAVEFRTGVGNDRYTIRFDCVDERRAVDLADELDGVSSTEVPALDAAVDAIQEFLVAETGHESPDAKRILDRARRAVRFAREGVKP